MTEPGAACIRSDAHTDGDAGVWHALCGRFKPPTSYSERHMREVAAGRIPPANVKICHECAAVLATGLAK
jgi:hypothetical protein